MKSNSGYIISGWMLNELNLRGNNLLVFALVYSFSKDGDSKFTGSLKWLSQATGASKNTVIKSLNELSDLEYIIKETEVLNGVIFNRYIQNEEVVQKLVHPGAETGFRGSAETGTNKYIYNNITSLHKVKMSDIEVSEDKLILKYKENSIEVDLKTGTMFQVANSFRKLFIENIENAGAKANDQRNAKFKPYMDSIRRIVEIDGYTGNDLRDVYLFLNSDTENALFWKKNVLSMSTLRKQMQKLIMAKNTPNRQQRQPDRN